MSELSQKDRKNRIGEAKKIAVVDDSIESFLLQAEEIAASLRYYNFSNKPDGYFDQFLSALKNIREKGIDKFVPDGNLEPSQALLLTFIHHLHTLGQSFNHRFKDLAGWYTHHFLNLKPLSLGRHKVCLAFRKNTTAPIHLEKDFGFLLKENKNETLVYRLSEDMFIGNVSVENIFALYFGKQKNNFPASYFDFVTSLRMKDLRNGSFNQKMLFTTEEKSEYARRLGFMITSPSLLLREGKRFVKIKLTLEDNSDIPDILNQLKSKILQNETIPSESIDYLFFHNIFYLNISTSEGWSNIENYIVNIEAGCFNVEFALPEDFPATSACETDIHQFSSETPTLSFILNLDAWLYPYSWMKNIFIKKISIETEVKDVNNILVYNDLGRIDNSKPFNPFGINTEKGAWFTIGNYEMALKHTVSVDLKIEWGQLPDCHEGLYGYYQSYNKNIDNTSFKVMSRYLSDYHWKNGNTLFLFSSEPQQEDHTPHPNAPLSKVSYLKDISVEKMPPIKIDEDYYDYNIHAQSGFISFSLIEPEIGFGEKHYRNIFTDYLIKNSLKRRNKTTAPNAPLTPQIERLTLSYKSYDEIDLWKKDKNHSESAFYHVSPLGNHLMYPSPQIDKVPLIYSMDTDANVLIQLARIEKGESLNLYFDFLSIQKEISLNEIPQIKWYLGNSYQWEEIPDGCILEDKTRNLLASGIVKINIPANIRDSFFDPKQKIWLRIGIKEHEDVISCLKNVYTNVGEAELKIDAGLLENDNPLHLTGELEAEKKIPGLESFNTISFYGGRKKESSEEMLMRMSEYVSHRGKAVTPRDIERIALQEFPEIGKVKCLPNYNSKSNEKGVVTLIVIPEKTSDEIISDYKPMANSRQILKMEFLLKRRSSSYIKAIDVINPLYEEVFIRCKIKFNRAKSTAACISRLQTLLNNIIAPWQENNKLPDFGHSFKIKDIHQVMTGQDFVEDIHQLSVIQMIQKNDEQYEIREYDKNYEIIKPSKTYAIFIPAKEHIILNISSEAGFSEQFGINEMIINENLIINEKTENSNEEYTPFLFPNH